MNGFNLSNISDLYVGSAKASAIYKGSNLIWQAAPDYSQEYLTIESLEDNNTISWVLSSSGTAKTIQWSTDMSSWTNATSTTSGTALTTLNTGDKLYLRGSESQYASSALAYNYFSSDSDFNISGNIMSLIYGDNFIGQTTLPSESYIFYSIFKASKVVNASNLILPAPTLVEYCYGSMFYGCTNLTTAPELPATTLQTRCYSSMFRNCTNLTTAPELPATTLTDLCYYYMFYGCTNLTTAPELPATTLTDYCYAYMFRNCTSLTVAPELPATTLANYCYQGMFNGCTSLSYIKCLATNISATSSHSNWVNDVAATGTFVKPSSMTSWSSGSGDIPSGWTVIDV